ncbi:MAG: hypothetical protein M3R00_00845, partial [Pseudomonadota bacterium]|nr:hypothetical protein [Pseudomonadota bacterium]
MKEVKCISENSAYYVSPSSIDVESSTFNSYPQPSALIDFSRQVNQLKNLSLLDLKIKYDQ